MNESIKYEIARISSELSDLAKPAFFRKLSQAEWGTSPLHHALGLSPREMIRSRITGALLTLAESIEEWLLWDNLRVMKEFPVGRFENLKSIHLTWEGPNSFRFRNSPDQNKQFSFYLEEVGTITPDEMFTDGGSTPQEIWWMDGGSPWAFGPAYLIHDWLYHRHHQGDDRVSFSQANDIMMSAIRTLVDYHDVPCSQQAFSQIDYWVNSDLAHGRWERPHTAVSLYG